ncbi:hypothetical protein [Streptomyces sp. NBC_00094]|uniref:hypothetical protein n=1 Tax=Streptomyces sp. NBC_00094 TaxID=2903620 RepID=UPI002252C5A6|nr:hypothetical protein [Streptomyces sp. NBC_00094]MCX5395383.1 hypothetical protein [Streptomyces sp. NBC_00094]
MSTTTLLVLLLLPTVGLLVLAVPGYLVWRHPRLGIPLTVACAFGALYVAAVLGLADL